MRRVIAIALLVMAMVALLPGAAGLYLQHRYQTLLEALADAGYEILEADYRLGWLSSETTTELAPADARGERQPRLRAMLVLEHGPRVWFGAESDADADSDSDSDESVRPTRPPLLATASGRTSVLGGPRALPPLRVAAKVGLTGGMDARLRVPDVAYSGQAGRLNLGSVGADVSVDGAGRWTLEAVVGSLETTAQDERRLGVSGIVLTLADAETSAALPLTDLAARFERLSLDAGAAAPALSLGGFKLQWAGRVRGASVELRLRAAAEAFGIDGESYAPSRLTLSLGGIDAAALEVLRARLGALDAQSLTPSQRGLATARVLLISLPELSSGSPRLRIEQLEVMTPDGTLSATADLRLMSLSDALPAASAAAPSVEAAMSDAARAEMSAMLHALAGGLEGSMRLSLSQSLLVAMIAEQQAVRVRRELALRGEPNAALPPTLAAEVDAAAQSAAAMLLREGWLAAQQGRLVAELRVEGGELRVNDRAVAVPGWFAPPAGTR